MMEYKVITANGNMDYVASAEDELLTFYPRRLDAEKTAALLNTETAPLLSRIAELEAALGEIAQGTQNAANQVYDYHFNTDPNVALHKVLIDLSELSRNALQKAKGETK